MCRLKSYVIYSFCLWTVINVHVSYGRINSSDVCSYPSSLKVSVEKALKKSCGDITEDELSQVTHLRLENVSSVSEIQPEDFSLLTHIESLDLSGNVSITEIPEFVYDLENLQRLNISSTKISDFDSRICQLTQLESLIGSHNNYRDNEIPFHTFCLENLRTLDMSNSSIIYMDEYLYYLQKLENLYMADNALFIVPVSFQYLSSLKFVDFTGNAFEKSHLNKRIDCNSTDDPEKIQDCQEEYLRGDFDCEWRYRFTHNRGESLRKYREMTDKELMCMEEAGGHRLRKHRFYTEWLAEQGGFADFSVTSGFDETGNYRGRNSLNAHLLDRTINGKTVREWRLAWSLYADLDCALWRDFDNLWLWWSVKDEHYAADMSEVFPEENKTPLKTDGQNILDRFVFPFSKEVENGKEGDNDSDKVWYLDLIVWAFGEEALPCY